MGFRITRWVNFQTVAIPTPSKNSPTALRSPRTLSRTGTSLPSILASSPGAPNRPFGIALNGVLFDPGTAEFWNGDRQLNWNYEALGGAVGLGLDENHAHVQPSGAYHYHGLPTPYLRSLGVDRKRHSPQVGWAADGFPVYALYGYEDPGDSKSPVVKLSSSYQLKDGQRPGGDDGPGGEYDGAFTRDYEFVEGSGTLDECNGRFCVTPEFPDGTYAYFLTTEWPVIPRSFRGTPAELRGPGVPGEPGRNGRPPRSSDKGKGNGKGKGKGNRPRSATTLICARPIRAILSMGRSTAKV